LSGLFLRLFPIRKGCFLFFVFSVFFISCLASVSQAQSNVFNPLRVYLLEQGFSKNKVDWIINHEKMRFEAKILARMLSVKESKLNYGRFLSSQSLARSRSFLHKHKKILNKAYLTTGVPPEVVVAILNVETSLGSYTGSHNTMSILASQAVLDTKQARKRLAFYWPKGRTKEISSQKNLKRFIKRAYWAKGEVVSLLKLSKKWRKNPFTFQGSPAGAFGMSQFVPTSALKWGKDGDNDGRVDLFTSTDAIFSVAHYLKVHGWQKGMSQSRQKSVILTYNKSTPYARTVLELARRLK
jgi:membrane-bound lytic murein transglycosylase B